MPGQKNALDDRGESWGDENSLQAHADEHANGEVSRSLYFGDIASRAGAGVFEYDIGQRVCTAPMPVCEINTVWLLVNSVPLP